MHICADFRIVQAAMAARWAGKQSAQAWKTDDGLRSTTVRLLDRVKKTNKRWTTHQKNPEENLATGKKSSWATTLSHEHWIPVDVGEGDSRTTTAHYYDRCQTLADHYSHLQARIGLSSKVHFAWQLKCWHRCTELPSAWQQILLDSFSLIRAIFFNY